ncbi:unnamed protein product [Camellia sinensis]
MKVNLPVHPNEVFPLHFIDGLNRSNMCSTSNKKFSLLIVCLPSSSEMINLTSRLCWNLVKEYIAIWQKPLNNSCCLRHEAGMHPPLCDSDDDPDSVW